MEGIFEYWYLFPISIVIATIAISSGVGGAVFFSPLFMLGLRLDPYTAIGAGLIIEVFGFSSGLYGYMKRKLIDYKFGRQLLLFSIPASLFGVLISAYIPNNWLMGIFAAGIILVGWQLFLSYQQDKKDESDIPLKVVNEDFESEIVDQKGTVHRYTICNKPLARFFSFVGGVFFGMISVGLAELQEYQLLVRCRIPTPIAVATSIFLVAVTVIFVSVFRIVIEFSAGEYEDLILIGKIILFSAPGVLIGGQIGPWLQHKTDPDKMKLFIAVLLPMVGLLTLWSLFV
ncbi:sulfite exporter TauE/SafE family protein [Salinicoccus albus]|uniref:sulfite exporter TauE/SafE family protein n=1 Tax=Salinicoccus albus TaxID=418756 RepID=UPI0003721F4A|nr:sulfite exporter TauE/SafE family protein [Salinicoccus albus]